MGEIFSGAQRAAVMAGLRRLGVQYPKLDRQDMVIDEFSNPPKSREACLFTRITETVSADLKTQITPCQSGGELDLRAVRLHGVDGATAPPAKPDRWLSQFWILQR